MAQATKTAADFTTDAHERDAFAAMNDELNEYRGYTVALAKATRFEIRRALVAVLDSVDYTENLKCSAIQVAAKLTAAARI